MGLHYPSRIWQNTLLPFYISAKVTAKTMPDPKIMGEYNELFSLLVKICPNCCLLPATLKVALEAINEEEAFHMKDSSFVRVGDFLRDVSSHIRTAFAKYREILTDSSGQKMKYVQDKARARHLQLFAYYSSKEHLLKVYMNLICTLLVNVQKLLQQTLQATGDEKKKIYAVLQHVKLPKNLQSLSPFYICLSPERLHGLTSIPSWGKISGKGDEPLMQTGKKPNLALKDKSPLESPGESWGSVPTSKPEIRNPTKLAQAIASSTSKGATKKILAVPAAKSSNSQQASKSLNDEFDLLMKQASDQADELLLDSPPSKKKKVEEADYYAIFGDEADWPWQQIS